MNATHKYTTTILGALLTIFLTLNSYANPTKLNTKQRAIIPIAAFTATGNLASLEPALQAGLDEGLTINEIKEIFIHSYAYVGFPRALNGINTFSDVLAKRQQRGVKDETGKSASEPPKDFDSNNYGNKTRNYLVGRDITHRTTGYAAFVPTINTFLVEHLFGDIFYRDIFTPQDRELITISMLAAMTGTEPQLAGHLGISLRVGYSVAQLQEFIQILDDKVSPISAQRAHAALKQHNPKGLAELPSKSVNVEDKSTVTLAPKARFTGTAKISSRFSSPVAGDFAGGLVEFEAGSRTDWHTHPKGQTLVVVADTGWVQSEGDEIQTITKGDVVTIPPKTKHWHGATTTTSMSHVAISAPLNAERAQWFEKVTLAP